MLRAVVGGSACAFIVVVAILAPTWQSTAPPSRRTPCFTPGEDCERFIVNQIWAAKSELLVQAYGFTNPAIIRALKEARQRGVEVKVILDKSNEQKRYTGAPASLQEYCIQPLVDDRVAIAHNKVMAIDGRHVITGSFNYTLAAQARNAENVLLISDDPALAQAYAANWQKRARQCSRLRGPCGPERGSHRLYPGYPAARCAIDGRSGPRAIRT
jgi:phosphatidylserine/phosphatidylglycerophosphate/cardiolipin synthase-like enzyme